jgi:hypothetical protein
VHGSAGIGAFPAPCSRQARAWGLADATAGSRRARNAFRSVLVPCSWVGSTKPRGPLHGRLPRPARGRSRLARPPCSASAGARSSRPCCPAPIRSRCVSTSNSSESGTFPAAFTRASSAFADECIAAAVQAASSRPTAASITRSALPGVTAPTRTAFRRSVRSRSPSASLIHRYRDRGAIPCRSRA